MFLTLLLLSNHDLISYESTEKHLSTPFNVSVNLCIMYNKCCEWIYIYKFNNLTKYTLGFDFLEIIPLRKDIRTFLESQNITKTRLLGIFNNTFVMPSGNTDSGLWLSLPMPWNVLFQMVVLKWSNSFWEEVYHQEIQLVLMKLYLTDFRPVILLHDWITFYIF